MNWFEARTWAAQLVYGGDDDWRLPTAWNRDGSPPSYGFYHGSELGHLSYDELGETGGPYPFGKPLLTDNNNPNLALFTNIMDSGPNPYWAVHWSGTLKSDTPFWADPDGAGVFMPGRYVMVMSPPPSSLVLLGAGVAGLLMLGLVRVFSEARRG